MSESKTTKINIFNRLQTKINNTTTKVKIDLIGTVLLDKYRIHSRINVASGESELYRCTDDQQIEYVVKIYQRENAIKPEIIEKLKVLNSPNVAKVIDCGVYQNYPFVILPYYRNGSLIDALLSKGVTFDLNDIKEFVLPSLNEGLNVLHKNGIIHKDLKPSNIMISDDGTNLVIIDFGISSDTNGGTVVVTKTGMTPTYLAPEALSNTYLKETDYYALGITLFELFTGHTPYENLNDDQIAGYASIQKIPYPVIFPKPLKNLINGLAYKDLSNRNDKSNPNRRWTYEEVKQWLDSDGKFVLEIDSNEVKGENNFNPSVNPSNRSENERNFLYVFKLKEYKDITSLAEQLLMNSKDGIKELGRGKLSKKLRETGENRLARICEDAESDLNFSTDENEIEKIFISLIYTIAPNLNKIVWNGLSYSNLIDYGNALITEVNNNNCQNKELITSSEKFLTNGLLNIWIKNHIEKKLVDSYIKILEINKELLVTSKLSPKDNALRLGYAITGRTGFVIGNKEYQSVKKLENDLDSLYYYDLKQYIKFFDNNYQELMNLSRVMQSNYKDGILNILNKYQHHKKSIFFIEEEPISRNFNEFEVYINNLKLKNSYATNEFFKKNKKNISIYFNTLNDSEKLHFKDMYTEFFTKAIGEIKIGNIVKFGNYFLSNNQNKEPIEWLVLDVSYNNALLITKDAIDCKPYNELFANITWEHCTLRQWLNIEFINQAFDTDEQKEILLTYTSNTNNSSYRTSGGNNTQDKIFLLCLDEVNKYFKDNKDRMCKPTRYTEQKKLCGVETCNWWLRSPGDDQISAAGVSKDGYINDKGYFVNYDYSAVRPALYINIQI